MVHEALGPNTTLCSPILSLIFLVVRETIICTLKKEGQVAGSMDLNEDKEWISVILKFKDIIFQGVMPHFLPLWLLHCIKIYVNGILIIAVTESLYRIHGNSMNLWNRARNLINTVRSGVQWNYLVL